MSSFPDSVIVSNRCKTTSYLSYPRGLLNSAPSPYILPPFCARPVRFNSTSPEPVAGRVVARFSIAFLSLLSCFRGSISTPSPLSICLPLGSSVLCLLVYRVSTHHHHHHLTIPHDSHPTLQYAPYYSTSHAPLPPFTAVLYNSREAGFSLHGSRVQAKTAVVVTSDPGTSLASPSSLPSFPCNMSFHPTVPCWYHPHCIQSPHPPPSSLAVLLHAYLPHLALLANPVAHSFEVIMLSLS